MAGAALARRVSLSGTHATAQRTDLAVCIGVFAMSIPSAANTASTLASRARPATGTVSLVVAEIFIASGVVAVSAASEGGRALGYPDENSAPFQRGRFSPGWPGSIAISIRSTGIPSPGKRRSDVAAAVSYRAPPSGGANAPRTPALPVRSDVMPLPPPQTQPTAGSA